MNGDVDHGGDDPRHKRDDHCLPFAEAVAREQQHRDEHAGLTIGDGQHHERRNQHITSVHDQQRCDQIEDRVREPIETERAWAERAQAEADDAGE